MVYVGRSCAVVPPLETVTWKYPSVIALRAAVPRTADGMLACFAKKLLARPAGCGSFFSFQI